MSTAPHRIHLDAFDGPLDLLLHLIRKAEVEITDIPIADIAEQYLAHLAASRDLDIDAAGEFLVMAATLMEIKSRVLTRAAEPPRTDKPGDEREQDDPRTELIRQLLAYKEHRDAADALERRRDLWILRFPSARAAADSDALLEAARERAELDIEDLTAADVAASYAALLRKVDLDRLGDHHVSIEDDDTPIELHQLDILSRVAEAGDLPLADLLRGRRRSEVVGLFIALLELVRERRLAVAARQDGDPSDIRLAPAPSEDHRPEQADDERTDTEAAAQEKTPGDNAPDA